MLANYKMIPLLILIIIVIVILIGMRRNTIDVLYVKNFLSREEHDNIKSECEKYNISLEDDDLVIVKNRKMYTLDKDEYITKLLTSRNVCDKLKFLGAKPNHTPVEYRVYENGGMMKWHRDDQMYRKPQYEIVYTVDNTSDSRTEWYDPDTNTIHGVSTEPNSILLVKATSVLHRVTPVNMGSRKILKFSYSRK